MFGPASPKGYAKKREREWQLLLNPRNHNKSTASWGNPSKTKSSWRNSRPKGQKGKQYFHYRVLKNTVELASTKLAKFLGYLSANRTLLTFKLCLGKISIFFSISQSLVIWDYFFPDLHNLLVRTIANLVTINYWKFGQPPSLPSEVSI